MVSYGYLQKADRPENVLKVGDKVKMAKDHADQHTSNGWSLGTATCTVRHLADEYITVEENPYSWWYWSFEKVEQQTLDNFDFLKTPWFVKIHSPEEFDAVTEWLAGNGITWNSEIDKATLEVARESANKISNCHSTKRMHGSLVWSTKITSFSEFSKFATEIIPEFRQRLEVKTCTLYADDITLERQKIEEQINQLKAKLKELDK